MVRFITKLNLALLLGHPIPPAWQLKLPSFSLYLLELAVGKELLHRAELFLRS